MITTSAGPPMESTVTPGACRTLASRSAALVALLHEVRAWHVRRGLRGHLAGRGATGSRRKAGTNRIRINWFVRESLDAFCSLAADLCQQPTQLAEIVPQHPSLLGATDATLQGMGGVYFCPQGDPCVWRFPFPEDVQRRLVSIDNPKGDITNSDLEPALGLHRQPQR